MDFKKTKMTLFASVVLSSLAFAQQPAASASANSNAPTLSPQLKAELIKFEKENGKIALDNLERMKDLNIKNMEVLYGQMIQNQKELNRLSMEVVEKDKSPNTVNVKSQEMQAQMKTLQESLSKNVEAENKKFQEMMQKRQADMSVLAAKINTAPAAATKAVVPKK